MSDHKKYINPWRGESEDVDPVDLHDSAPRSWYWFMQWRDFKHMRFRTLRHRRGAQGADHALWARVLAGLNFLFLVFVILDFLVFTSNDDSTADWLMRWGGQISYVLYVATTPLMMIFYSFARILHEFPDGYNSQKAEYPVVQSWVIFSGLICMFTLCFRFMIWFNET
ncbi:MAG TPA: hypothetical protein DCM28_15995 [Phycisphaerales bacterium]|nr:hypothetical protein [Phycisphaerales bacterium]HCD30819.1 hypothetical protein [Phycisphaerales bacterium]|tara:strand:- start:231 stop:734 length:504 start_codon:yes stop_codon:yes gene_type:complete